jgi:putative phage-type endonuclease
MIARTEEWHALRKTGIGGSDAAAVLGISSWKTPYEIYLEKIGENTPTGDEDSFDLRRGRALENFVLDEYRRATGLELEPGGFLRHPEIPWLIGNPDARAQGDGRIVEAKTARNGQGWGDPGTDEIPLPYLTQVHHYLMADPAAPCADLPVLIAGSEFRIYHVERDYGLQADLIAQYRPFWRCVEERTPPAPVSTREAIQRWGRLARTGSVMAGRTAVEAVELLRDLHLKIKVAEARKDLAQAVVMAALGETGDTLIDDAGHILATWKMDKGRKEYTVAARDPSRRFLLKGEK